MNIKEKLSKLQCLDGFSLKMLAMITMLIDHAGYVLFPQHFWLRMIGRLAFPIFAFFVAEGFHYTKDPVKYMLRLGVFALISEPCFDITFHGRLTMGATNVMVTFLLAVIGLYIMKKTNKYMGVAAVIVCAFVADLLHTDYGAFGVCLVFIYSYLRENFLARHGFATLLQILGSVSIQRLSAISTIPLMLYNGKRGIGLKYLFYAFYPCHLVILHIIANFMG